MRVAGVSLVGVGDRLEEEVVDERSRLHAAHLEPESEAAGFGLVVDGLLDHLVRLRGKADDRCRDLDVLGARCHGEQSTAPHASVDPQLGAAGSRAIPLEVGSTRFEGRRHGHRRRQRLPGGDNARSRRAESPAGAMYRPGRGANPDRPTRVDQLRGRRGRADVDVRRHVPHEQLDLHLRERLPGCPHRPGTRTGPRLLQLRRPPRRQEGRPPCREGRSHAHPRGVAVPRHEEERRPREQAWRDGDPVGRRRLHLLEPARLPRQGPAAPSTSRPSSGESII